MLVWLSFLGSRERAELFVPKVFFGFDLTREPSRPLWLHTFCLVYEVKLMLVNLFQCRDLGGYGVCDF